MRGCLLAVALALVIILVWAAVRATRRYDSYLEGMWSGNFSFLAQAGLRDFNLYIGPRGSDGRRSGYLIMADKADGLVANHSIEITERSDYLSGLLASFRGAHDVYSPRDFAITSGPDTSVEISPLPPHLRVSLSMLDGTLTLFDKSDVYAYLEKDIAASTVAAEAARN